MSVILGPLPPRYTVFLLAWGVCNAWVQPVMHRVFNYIALGFYYVLLWSVHGADFIMLLRVKLVGGVHCTKVLSSLLLFCPTCTLVSYHATDRLEDCWGLIG